MTNPQHRLQGALSALQGLELSEAAPPAPTQPAAFLTPAENARVADALIESIDRMRGDWLAMSKRIARAVEDAADWSTR